jgi:beta-glucosidase
MLSHGYAVEALRAAARRPSKIGIALNLSPIHPASDSDEDCQAAALIDSLTNRLFLDPLLRGHYPEPIQTWLNWLSLIRPGDMQCIAAPLDFVGVNYYSRTVIQNAWYVPFVRARQVQPRGGEYSQMWEIYPPGIYDLLARVWTDYRPADIIVTENGIPVPDYVESGRVCDEQRIRYLRDHIAQVHCAIEAGIPVSGYLVWSLMDNFEWTLGYAMRFGLVHVDLQTQARTIKDSGHWYAQVIQENGLNSLA